MQESAGAKILRFQVSSLKLALRICESVEHCFICRNVHSTWVPRIPRPWRDDSPNDADLDRDGPSSCEPQYFNFSDLHDLT